MRSFRENLLCHEVRWNPVTFSQTPQCFKQHRALEIPFAFVLLLWDFIAENSLKEINNPLLQTYPRGNIYQRSYKISEALSLLRNEYVHELFKIADRKVITSLNTTINALYICQEVLWPLEATDSVWTFCFNAGNAFLWLSCCSFSALSSTSCQSCFLGRMVLLSWLSSFFSM